MSKNKVVNNFVYRIVETFGIQAIQLIISLVLARLLLPENYGVVAIASTIVTILTSVVQSSFNAPLVQKKELTNTDLSSSFYVMLGIAGFAYGVLFLIAPCIAELYKMPDLVLVIRVLSLVLILGSWNSIQMAIIYRSMKFRASMLINVIGIIVQGIVGIGLAYMSFGVWSLVFSQITYQLIVAVIYGLYNKWIPGICFSIDSIKAIWKIGLPLCGAEMMTIVSSNIYPMIIGLKYSKAELGLYQKGNSVPSAIVNGTVSAFSTVLFPMMSRIQDDSVELKKMTQKGVGLTSFLIVPIAIGLLCVSKEFVFLALGKNWLDATSFMQIACLTLSLYPLRIRLQAIKAIGQAKHSLYINTFYAILSNAALLVFVNISLKAAIFSLFCAEIVFASVTGLYLKKDLGYTFREQIADVLPSYLFAGIVVMTVSASNQLFSQISICSFLAKIVIGTITYLVCALVVKPNPVKYIFAYAKAR